MARALPDVKVFLRHNTIEFVHLTSYDTTAEKLNKYCLLMSFESKLNKTNSTKFKNYFSRE